MTFKPIAFVCGALISVSILMPVDANAQFRPFRPDNSDFATEYCRYYKTRALFARHRAHQGISPKANKRRFRVLWSKYRACLIKYATPATSIPPK